MVTKKGSSKNFNKSVTISFRGDKDKWIDFQYTTKKEGHKNVWVVLEPMLDEYLKNHTNSKVPK